MREQLWLFTLLSWAQAVPYCEQKSRDFHGIIIEESLRDRSLIDKMRILGKKTGRRWTMLRVQIDERHLESLAKLIQGNLLTDNGVPYYCHFYREGELIVIFPERIFRLKPDKSTWNPAVSYGMSLGIPKEELDFRPCRFEDETY